VSIPTPSTSDFTDDELDLASGSGSPAMSASSLVELGLLVLAALFVGVVSVLVGAFALLVALRG
jgi:hypothetical protein